MVILPTYNCFEQGEFYIFYELTNFYQNHRRYARDIDEKQLYGIIEKSDKSQRKRNCRDPFRISESGKVWVWHTGDTDTI